MKKKVVYIIILFSIFYILNNLTINSDFICNLSVLIPIKIYSDLTSPDKYKLELYKKGGVYGIINISNVKKRQQYIGSTFNLYERLLDHIKGRDSNIRLKRSISKYGINNFIFVIYYWHNDPAVILTDIETEVIKSFCFKDLYNFKKEATSMLGYKHTLEAIKKMKLRFKDKTKHPMYGKTHDNFALSKISKPGKLNPMFNKKHNIVSIKKMSLAKSKTPLGLYDFNNNLIEKFINQVELGKYLNLHKTTIGRYLKTGKLILNKFYIRKINK